MKKIIYSVVLLGMGYVTAHVQAQPPAPPKPPTAQERLKHITEKMVKDLQLSQTQKEKLVAAYKVFFTDMDKLRGKEKPMPSPPPPPPPADRVAAERITKERDDKIKQALTSTQYKKYMELEKQMRPGEHGNGGKNEPPPQR